MLDPVDPLDNLIETFLEHLPRLRELREKMAVALATGQISEACDILSPQLRDEMIALKRPLEDFMDDRIEEKLADFGLIRDRSER